MSYDVTPVSIDPWNSSKKKKKKQKNKQKQKKKTETLYKPSQIVCV